MLIYCRPLEMIVPKGEEGEPFSSSMSYPKENAFKEEEQTLKMIVEPLLSWYAVHARRLPWRTAPQAYTTWVSEIMLQQTRVETVIPYYERFVRELPDVAALARCPEEQLLKLWEGLGYYSRVRNMQEAARQIVHRFQGRIPSGYDELRSLKGIGDYTAGAIASIAFGEAVPAVDGNVLRVMARLTDDHSDIMRPTVRRYMTQLLSTVIPHENPGSFNQAMMELGALICVPGNRPDCTGCPVSRSCLAHTHRTQAFLPVRSRKKERKTEDRTILILMDENGRIALSKRPSRGLLAGMYEPVNLSGRLSVSQVENFVLELGLVPLKIRTLPDARHIFSHIEWKMTGCLIRVSHPEEADLGQLVFVEQDKIGIWHPVPSAFSTYMNLILKRSANEITDDRSTLL